MLNLKKKWKIIKEREKKLEKWDLNLRMFVFESKKKKSKFELVKKKKKEKKKKKKKRKLVWRYWPYFLKTCKKSYWILDEGIFYMKKVQLKKENPLIYI